MVAFATTMHETTNKVVLIEISTLVAHAICNTGLLLFGQPDHMIPLKGILGAVQSGHGILTTLLLFLHRIRVNLL